MRGRARARPGRGRRPIVGQARGERERRRRGPPGRTPPAASRRAPSPRARPFPPHSLPTQVYHIPKTPELNIEGMTGTVAEVVKFFKVREKKRGRSGRETLARSTRPSPLTIPTPSLSHTQNPHTGRRTVRHPALPDPAGHAGAGGRQESAQGVCAPGELKGWRRERGRRGPLRFSIPI